MKIPNELGGHYESESGAVAIRDAKHRVLEAQKELARAQHSGEEDRIARATRELKAAEEELKACAAWT